MYCSHEEDFSLLSSGLLNTVIPLLELGSWLCCLPGSNVVVRTELKGKTPMIGHNGNDIGPEKHKDFSYHHLQFKSCMYNS